MTPAEEFERYTVVNGRDALLKTCFAGMFAIFCVGVSFTGYLYKNSELLISFALFAVFSAAFAIHQAKRFHRHFSRLS